MHTLRQRRSGTKATIQEWQQTQRQQGPMAKSEAKRNDGEMQEEVLHGQLRRQVEEASRRIGYENIKAVHAKYAKGSKDGIKVDVFKQALSEVRQEFEHVSDEEAERYFVEMDVESNGALDLEEFRHALRRLFPIEQAVSTLPLSRVISSSLPGLHGMKTEDHLEAFSKLQANEIAAMASAVSHELEKLLLEMVCGLRMGFEVKKRADGNDAGAKFSVSGSVTMSGGRVEDFHGGLAQRVGEFVNMPTVYEVKGLKTLHVICAGAPDLAFDEAVRLEHCNKEGHDFEFTTSNYKIKTTSKKEYEIVVNNAPVDPADMMHSRRIPSLKELQELDMSKTAELRMIEIIMLVLYTGPMFMIYNAILRRFPASIFDVFNNAQNLYPTSIHVLQSAVTKIARNTKIPTGLKLYRGLSMAFPKMFYESDKNGCRGFAEWGFMSTTTNRGIAVMYCGVKEGKKDSAVLEIRTSSVDRAACIQMYSQYMGECEYLWVPLSFLESTGAIRKEATEHGVLTVMELRVNSNGKVMTTNELVGMKRTIHLKAFATSVDSFSFRKMPSMSHKQNSKEESNALELGSKAFFKKEEDWKKLRAAIVKECREKLAEHEKQDANDFTNEAIYRKLITEMMDTERFASSKAEWWEKSGDDVATVMMGEYRPLRTCHRLLLGEQRKTLEKLEAGSEEETRAATEICLTLGLFVKSPDESNELGEQRLTQAAADNASPDALRLLLKARADINAATKPGGFTATYRAAQFGNTACLQVLVEAKADVNLAEDDGATPAWMAAQNGNLGCLKLLKQGGADFDKPDNSKDTDKADCSGGDTPAHMAVLYGKLECLQWLKEAGADLSKTNSAGRTPAFIAARYGIVDCLQWLIKAGVDIEAADEEGRTPFLGAATYGKEDSLLLLKEAGADINAVDNEGKSAIHLAAETGQLGCIKFLREGAGADINQEIGSGDYHGLTASVLAAMNGQLECLKFLVETGAKFTIEPCRAVQYEQFDCVKFLVEAKADINVQDGDEFTPVAHAAYYGFAEPLQLLMEAGADIDKVDAMERTPLFYAADQGNLECLQLLKEAGSDVNAADNEGAKPLSAAAQNGHLECLRFLIGAGAEINATNNEGKTALTCAEEQDKSDCVQLLKDAGAKQALKNA